jgi:hypothetical protein
MTADVAAAGIVEGRDVAAGGFSYGDLASCTAERGRSDAFGRYERKGVAARGPYLQIHRTNDAAELHNAFDVGPLLEGVSASLSRKMQRR